MLVLEIRPPNRPCSVLPAYLLTTAGFQLVFGKLYTFFSIRWVFLAAIVIFELGSLVCGVAPSSTALIVGRAIAGLGSAGIFSGAYLIIAVSQPLEKRPTFQGLFGAMYGIASIVGPLMGECVTAFSMPFLYCCFGIVAQEADFPKNSIHNFIVIFAFTAPYLIRVLSTN